MLDLYRKQITVFVLSWLYLIFSVICIPRDSLQVLKISCVFDLREIICMCVLARCNCAGYSGRGGANSRFRYNWVPLSCGKKTSDK